ncbi:MAG: DAK2 domain-containing protein [Oscillospiraceae bacterium]|jgi:DAK2 domain fusion protein YloV|nr:DAK2 domain-containing protein [Oscillospiraceae bacterium]
MITGNKILAALREAAYVLNQNSADINALNVFPVPDSDTGTNMSVTLSAAVERTSTLPTDSPAHTVTACAASAALRAARGNSGVILSLILQGFAHAVKNRDVLNGEDIAAGLTLGAQRAYSAVLNPVEGTILSVAKRAAERAATVAKSYAEPIEVLASALAEAQLALADTTNLLPELKNAGVVDAGGQGLVYILQAMHASLSGKHECGKKGTNSKHSQAPQASKSKLDLLYAYCLDFTLFYASEATLSTLRKYLETAGDSLIFAEEGGLLKVHLHTNNPEEILRQVSKFGQLGSSNFEDMRSQNILANPS